MTSDLTFYLYFVLFVANFQVNFADEYPYVVVQFLQLPYANIGDYVCIPRSWIRVRRPTDRKSTIAYPDEPPSITRMRIMNCDEPSEKWNLYMAIIKAEKCSFKDANDYIMEKIDDALRKRYLAVIRTGYECVPATARKQYCPSLKPINLSNAQSKKNINKLEVDKVRQTDTISNLSEYPEHSNVESRTLTSSKLTVFVSSENTAINENYKKENQDQTSCDVRPSSDDLLLSHPYIQRKPEKDTGTQVNSSEAGSRSTGKTLYASKAPLTFVNQICDYALKTEENQPLSINHKHSHHLALTRGIQNQRIPNILTCTLDLPQPLIQDPNNGLNTLFAIKNPTNEDNHFCQLNIPKSSPVIQEHPQVLPKQKTPGYSSEVECATSDPAAYGIITSASHASMVCTNSAEHQDSIAKDMVVDELTEASCFEQSVFSETRPENESSANPKALEEANYLGQTEESFMEEGSPMSEVVMSSEISSTQDVNNDEQSDCSDISSDEIITISPNSIEQANQSAISLLNRADVWADQLYNLFQRMKIDISETCQLTHDLQKSLVKSQRVLECIANSSENLRALKKGKIAKVTSKEVVAEVQQIAKVNQAERKEEESLNVNIEEDEKEDNDVNSKSSENDDDFGGDIKDVNDQYKGNEVPKTTRGHIRSFVLPPEYDPHDTKWTLKYRENDPELNLVELVPGSNVFINYIKLAHCMRSATDSKALARKLLEEIFTRSALSVCSYTGVRANAFDISGTNVRPGLDANARMAILTFVKKQTLKNKKKWGSFELKSVTSSLRSKIQDIRAKHGKTA